MAVNNSDFIKFPVTDEEIIADLNSNQKVKLAFLELVESKGYPSLSDYMLSELRREAAQIKQEKLRNLGAKMFPEGISQNK